MMIYLDNAATTFPKPMCVAEEMKKCLLTYGGNPGRGGHALAMAAAKKIYECRTELCELFCAEDTDRVFFVPNATWGINTVLKGVLKKGDHVVISDMEHNAVWRPISNMAEKGIIEYDVFKTFTGKPEQTPWRICANIAKVLKPNTKMVFCTHASNICSASMPIKEIGEFCRKRGLFFATDGAQAAGHENINVRDMNIDALCVPGHKGLYGPQGSGAVILGKDIMIDTLIEGGNGVDSLAPIMPLQAPERYEAGTLSTPAIAGLCEGVRTLRRTEIDKIANGERETCRRICEMLGNMDDIELYAPEYRGSIVLFNFKGVPSEMTASELDKYGVCVRGGYHCAALAHKTLGTPEGGAVRISVGMYNRAAEVDSLYRILKSVSKAVK
jgi:cysteine desulfurase family protein